VEGEGEQEKESILASNDMCEEAPESMYYSPVDRTKSMSWTHGVESVCKGLLIPRTTSSDAKTLQAASVVWENHHTRTALHASWCEKLGVENQQCQVGCSEHMWNRRRPRCCTSPRYQQASRKPMRPHLNHSHPWVEKGWE